MSASSQSLETAALRVQLPAFPGPTLGPEARTLLTAGLGGVCLFGDNTAGGPESVAAYAAAVHEAGPLALVAIDEEGGDVTRLHVPDGSPVPGPAALGRLDDPAATRAVGAAVGAELAALGVDLDLGPIADVNSNPDNPVIGTRSFGAEPDLVARHVAAWVAGLQQAGVAACAKHFPGHGDTDVDSHLALPRLDADLATLRRRELVPFGAAVAAGAAAVMTSHLVVSAIDPTGPATLSAPVLALLREELGFDGLLVSDALDMAGACAGRGIPEAAVLAVGAGADLLCLGPRKDAELVRAVQSALLEAVASGRLPETRLLEAAARVEAVRPADASRGRTAAEPPDEGPGAATMASWVRRALAVAGPLPGLAGARVLSLATQPNIAVGEGPWGLRPDLVVDPADLGPGADASVRGVPDGVPLVVQVRDAGLHPELSTLLDRVAAHAPGRVVVVEWGWPGAWERPEPRVCTYGCSRPAVAAVTELLREAGWDR